MKDNITIEGKSVTLAIGYFFLDIISRVSQSDISFTIAALVGITTVVYNVVRIKDHFKRKKNKDEK